MIAALLEALPQVPSEYAQYGAYGAMVALLGYFIKNSLATFDKRMADTSASITALTVAHTATTDKVVVAFQAAMAASNARNEELADRIAESTKVCAERCNVSHATPHPRG